MSSAARSSGTIVRARPYTRRWKRRTNADAASWSPVARPATNASSDTVHTEFYGLQRRGIARTKVAAQSILQCRPYSRGPVGTAVPNSARSDPEAVPEEPTLRAGVGVVVVGDVAHVVVDPVLDGERLAGDPGEVGRACAPGARPAAPCRGGATPPSAPSQISHSAIQHTSSSWNHGVMRAASHRSQSSTLTNCGCAGVGQASGLVPPGRRRSDADLGALPRDQRGTPGCARATRFRPAPRSGCGCRSSRRRSDAESNASTSTCPCTAHMSRSSSSAHPRLVVVRHHHDARVDVGDARRAARRASARRALNALVRGRSSRASTRLHATP